MSKPGPVLAVTFVLAATTLLGLSVPVARDAAAYTPHAPIVIDGDSGFVPANGVTGGTGIPADPYRIEGWDISAATGDGVTVQNTTARFVIRDVRVHDGNVSSPTQMFAAVALLNVSNGRVERLVSVNNGNGVWVRQSSGIDVVGFNATLTYASALTLVDASNVRFRWANLTGNGIDCVAIIRSRDVVLDDSNLTNNVDGIHIAWSTNVTVDGNVIERVSVSAGVFVESSQQVRVTNNQILRVMADGVLVRDSSFVTIAGNHELNSFTGSGIRAETSTDLTISGNDLSWNGDAGIVLVSSFRVTVFGNRVYTNAMADISLVASGGVLVFHNAFGKFPIAALAFDDRGSENAWDDGYPGGGNWWLPWGTYQPVDNCSGPAQDVCPDPDGISDVPFIIDQNTTDRYPLMAPCGPDCPPVPPIVHPAEFSGAGLANVLLTWDRSPDDGGGERDVSGYEVWYNSSYSSGGVGYQLLASLPAGTTSYEELGGGVGNVLPYYYQVRVLDQGGARSVSAVTQAAKFTALLSQGQNLVSSPLEVSDWRVDSVLRTVPWTTVRTFVNDGGLGRWLTVKAGASWSPLQRLNRTTAAWVNLTYSAWWMIAGLVPRSTTIALTPGWNLVGFPKIVGGPIADLLQGIPYGSVEGFDPTPPYFLARLTGANWMMAGQGYWIDASGTANLRLSN